MERKRNPGRDAAASRRTRSPMSSQRSRRQSELRWAAPKQRIYLFEKPREVDWLDVEIVAAGRHGLRPVLGHRVGRQRNDWDTGCCRISLDSAGRLPTPRDPGGWSE